MITTRPKEKPERILDHIHDGKINNLQISNKGNRNNLAGIHCNISINNKSASTTIIGLLDSGARANLISYNIYEKFLKEDKEIPTKTPPNRLIAANGEEMPIYKFIQININLKGINLKTWVYVIKKLGYPLLLGIQFMRDLDATWDFANNKFRITDPRLKHEGEQTEIDIIKLNDENSMINRIQDRPFLFMTKVRKNKWIMPNCIRTLDLELHGYKIKRNSYYIVEKLL